MTTLNVSAELYDCFIPSILPGISICVDSEKIKISSNTTFLLILITRKFDSLFIAIVT